MAVFGYSQIPCTVSSEEVVWRNAVVVYTSWFYVVRHAEGIGRTTKR